MNLLASNPEIPPTGIDADMNPDLGEYSPSIIAPPQGPVVEDREPDPGSAEPSAEEVPDVPMSGVDVPVPEPTEDELLVHRSQEKVSEHIFELSIDITPEDITDNPLCLWRVLDECFQVTTSKAKQRRVEVNFRKLSPADKKLFEKAMQKEWQSWVDNKLTSICKARGIPAERIIRCRWVLVWKKSSDPDVRVRTPKARLVLVGWQEPDLGSIATDSPTLRKERKHLVLSTCSSMMWKLWAADIKTAFLSGDESCRNIYFRPPPEVREWLG